MSPLHSRLDEAVSLLHEQVRVESSGHDRGDEHSLHLVLWRRHVGIKVAHSESVGVLVGVVRVDQGGFVKLHRVGQGRRGGDLLIITS